MPEKTQIFKIDTYILTNQMSYINKKSCEVYHKPKKAGSFITSFFNKVPVFQINKLVLNHNPECFR